MSDIKLELPTLYARSETGNVLEWDIQILGNKYCTITGTRGGKKITSDYTNCLGKNIGKANETTPESQAYAEASAKWTKKLKSGYWEDEKDIDKAAYFQPQLAHKYLDYKDDIDWTNGVYISPKLDGCRCVTTIDGMYSRNGKPFLSSPHILRELMPLFDKNPGLRLDGELYAHKLKSDFDKIISLARKTKPTPEDIAESEEKLEYWIYDCPSVPGGYHERYTWLRKEILGNFYNHRNIKLCIHKLVKTSAELEDSLQYYIEHGFEGLMVNLYDGEYQQKRSKNLLKYKEFIDDEFLITNISEGVGNRAGGFGYATLMMPSGKSFDSSARGNIAEWKGILANMDDYIGKKATVRYQNLTPDGIPRFPVIIDWNRDGY